MMATRRRLIDVSHTVEHGMTTYKGFPAPIICDWLSREVSRTKYAPGTEFQIGKIEMIANTGTYVDSPFHRYENGKDLSELPLESLADLECLVVRVDPAAGSAIDQVPLAASQVGGRAVLFDTGWDRHWRTRGLFRRSPLPDRARGRVAGEGRRGSRGDRLAEHRQCGHRRASRAHGPAGKRDPDRRTHVRSRGASG